MDRKFTVPYPCVCVYIVLVLEHTIYRGLCYGDILLQTVYVSETSVLRSWCTRSFDTGEEVWFSVSGVVLTYVTVGTLPQAVSALRGGEVSSRTYESLHE